MSQITIFAPSPILTVTVEESPAGDEIHIHAGGQGVWQSRMLSRFGMSITMCCVLSGETGTVLRHLLEDEGITVAAIVRGGRGAVYVHDRRNGERAVIAEEPGDPLGRHELDELYGATLREGLASGLVILSGPADDETLPADTYRRLAADLRTAGSRVLVDLSGDRLDAAVEGGVDVLKVSDEELHADGLAAEASVPALMRAMRALHERGAATVIVSRSPEPTLLLDDDGFLEVTMAQLEETDTRGAGDSLTAGVAAGLAGGESAREAVTLGAAAGALNVTRHGLGTGDPAAIAELRKTVRVRDLAEGAPSTEAEGATGRVSPDGLAALAQPASEDGPPEETP